MEEKKSFEELMFTPKDNKDQTLDTPLFNIEIDDKRNNKQSEIDLNLEEYHEYNETDNLSECLDEEESLYYIEGKETGQFRSEIFKKEQKDK